MQRALILLPDKILLMLKGAGPRTNSELAVLLNHNMNSIRGANSKNRAMGWTEYVEDLNPLESLNRLTQAGLDRIDKKLMHSIARPPLVRVKTVKEPLLKALKAGVASKDFQQFCTRREGFRTHIADLRKEGHVIERSKGKNAIYKLKE